MTNAQQQPTVQVTHSDRARVYVVTSTDLVAATVFYRNGSGWIARLIEEPTDGPITGWTTTVEREVLCSTLEAADGAALRHAFDLV